MEVITRGGSSKHSGNSAAAVVTYGSGLLYPVSHLHATFGVGLNKKQPLFIHGAVEQGAASTSDPSTSKVGNWGLTDFEAFKHFADLYVGEIEYGLGPGEVVGMSNVMDLSQSYGKVYGEACPGGRVFYTSASEQRGRFLSISSAPQHEHGVPNIDMVQSSVCSVWIAKSESILKTTGGNFGILAGFSNGVLAAFALGINVVNERRFEKGEATAKWVLSPGVPIIAICVDQNFSARRQGMKRVWAVVLNALGEVFYLTDVPAGANLKGRAKASEIDSLAWQTGGTVEWHLIETTRRVAKPDPFNTSPLDGSYTPRSSSHASGLSSEQIMAETKEIEKFLAYKPKHFRNICEGWDMQRKLVVDFGGDDRHGAGESIFVINTGMGDGKASSIRRLTRRKAKTVIDHDQNSFPGIPVPDTSNSIFGRKSRTVDQPIDAPPDSAPRSRASSRDDYLDGDCQVDWRQSQFSFGLLRQVQLSAVAMDDSEFASLAAFEDPLLGMSGGSNSSSPLASPLGRISYVSSTSEIPGHRARYLAVGTNSGIVLLWDMRASISPAADVVNTVQPLRAIYTRSPQISSLGLTALYLVHGGNDGLVQAWDPLASTSEPIRTLNSRFSDRARRRIAQAEASAQGVGNNYYAAGAIALDPDPTVLRGMVSLGTHLRYWSYSASAADAYRGRKRIQLRRRSDRGSNSAGNEQRYSHGGRGALNDYIATERQEMERDKLARVKESERLSGRFGTDLLGEGASEEDLLRYAMIISEESWESDQAKRQAVDHRDLHGDDSPRQRQQAHKREESDPDLAEAIRLSLLEGGASSPSPPPTTEAASSGEPEVENFQVPVRYAKASRRGGRLKATVAGSSSQGLSSSAEGALLVEEESDLEYVLQLSLVEERSRREEAGIHDGELDGESQEYPALPGLESDASGSGTRHGRHKGKGKEK